MAGKDNRNMLKDIPTTESSMSEQISRREVWLEHRRELKELSGILDRPAAQVGLVAIRNTRTLLDHAEAGGQVLLIDKTGRPLARVDSSLAGFRKAIDKLDTNSSTGSHSRPGVELKESEIPTGQRWRIDVEAFAHLWLVASPDLPLDIESQRTGQILISMATELAKTEEAPKAVLVEAFRWFAQRLNTFTDEFAKAAGKTSGTAAALGAGLAVSGHMPHLVELARRILRQLA